MKHLMSALLMCAMIMLSGAKPKDDSCSIGSVHACHCPRMVARAEAKVDHQKAALCVDFLSKSKSKPGDAVDYVACLRDAGVKEPCEVVATPDKEHLDENCKVAC